MRRFCSALAVAALMVPALIAQQRPTEEDSGITHVLLISVDGLHALDVSRYVETHPHSAFRIGRALAPRRDLHQRAHAGQL